MRIKKSQKFFFLIATFFLFSGNVFAAPTPSTLEYPADEFDTGQQYNPDGTVKKPTPKTDHSIKLLKPFKKGEKEISTEGGAIAIIERYVSKIFLFGSGLVTIVAVIWILIGGYEIMFRGSFAGSVEEGKTKITHALLGIVLLLLSALILHLINPGFFSLGGGSAVTTEKSVEPIDNFNPEPLPKGDFNNPPPEIPGAA